MMYILTQEEFDALKAVQKTERLENTKKIQVLCTKIADTMPVKWGWGGPDPKPWGCFITREQEGEEWYCDKCPVQTICPSPRRPYSQ